MKCKVRVVSERIEEYTGKRGLVKQPILSLQDVEEESRLLNTFDYPLRDEEATRYGGKLLDKLIVVHISSLEAAFGGRFRARGKLVVG